MPFNFYEMFLENPTKFLGAPFLKNTEIIDEFCPEFSEKIINGKKFKVDFRELVKVTYDKNNIKSANEFFENIPVEFSHPFRFLL